MGVTFEFGEGCDPAHWLFQELGRVKANVCIVWVGVDEECPTCSGSGHEPPC